LGADSEAILSQTQHFSGKRTRRSNYMRGIDNTEKGQSVMTSRTFMKSALAAAVALSAAAALATPSFAAAPHHHHLSPGYGYSAPGYGYGPVNRPGIIHPLPSQTGWGNECMVDNGQGRYFPCDAAGGA
jgi:hypothetical protein